MLTNEQQSELDTVRNWRAFSVRLPLGQLIALEREARINLTNCTNEVNRTILGIRRLRRNHGEGGTFAYLSDDRKAADLKTYNRILAEDVEKQRARRRHWFKTKQDRAAYPFKTELDLFRHLSTDDLNAIFSSTQYQSVWLEKLDRIDRQSIQAYWHDKQVLADRIIVERKAMEAAA